MNPLQKWAWAALLSSVVVGSSASAEDWPKWRGPHGTGHVAEGSWTPQAIPSSPKVVWRLKVGEGLASPVVADGKLFYFDAQEGRETLHAIDAKSRQKLWSSVIDDTFKDSQGPAGPRCTPLVDGDRVYAVSCKGELRCLEAATGKTLWRINYTNDLGAVFIGEKGNIPGAARHGNNGSPAIDGDLMYIAAGGTNGASVVCLRKKSGEIVWKSQDDQTGYAPPVVAELAGTKQVICFTVDGLIGLEAANGKLLWRVPMQTAYGRHVTTPVIVGDVVVVGSHQAGLIGTRVTREGTAVKAEQVWLNKDAAMNFASPVAVGSYIYGLGPRKNLICIEAATGRQAWSKEGYFSTSADKAHAGLIVMKDRILVLTDGGEIALFAATPEEFKEFGRAQVCGINWCNPAYADGRLYVRDGVKNTGDLYCVDLKP